MILWFMAAKRSVQFGVSFDREAAKVSGFDIILANVFIFDMILAAKRLRRLFLTFFWLQSGHGVHFGHDIGNGAGNVSVFDMIF